jgi:hypothetical protein
MGTRAWRQPRSNPRAARLARYARGSTIGCAIAGSRARTAAQSARSESSAPLSVAPENPHAAILHNRESQHDKASRLAEAEDPTAVAVNPLRAGPDRGPRAEGRHRPAWPASRVRLHPAHRAPGAELGDAALRLAQRLDLCSRMMLYTAHAGTSPGGHNQDARFQFLRRLKGLR